MAYMNQERKQKLAPKIKDICKRYGVKASIAVRHHSTLVVTITQGTIDFIGNYNDTIDYRDPTGNRHLNKAASYLDVNPYWYQDHFTGDALAFLKELVPAMNVGNHDRSDISTDYFDVGWYIDVNVGRWDKPYQLVK